MRTRQGRGHLFSAANGTFHMHSAMNVIRRNRAPLEKSGAIARPFDIGSATEVIENWRTLSQDDKVAYLTFRHELQHFIDFSSFPIGVLIWRCYTFAYQLYSEIIYFARENRYPSVGSDFDAWAKPVLEAIRKEDDAGNSSFAGIWGKRQSAPELAAHPMGSHKQLFKFMDWLNKPHSFGKAGLSQAVSSFSAIAEASGFILNPRFIIQKDQQIKGPGFFSLVEILEIRARLAEAIFLRENDEAFLEILWTRIEEPTASNLRYCLSRFPSPWFLLWVTDIALSGCLDVTSVYHSGWDEVDIARELPSYRLAAILRDFQHFAPPFLTFEPRKFELDEVLSMGRLLFGPSNCPINQLKLFVGPLWEDNFWTPHDFIVNENRGALLAKTEKLLATNSLSYLARYRDIGLDITFDWIKKSIRLNCKNYADLFMGEGESYIPPLLVFFRDGCHVLRDITVDDSPLSTRPSIVEKIINGAIKRIVDFQIMDLLMRNRTEAYVCQFNATFPGVYASSKEATLSEVQEYIFARYSRVLTPARLSTLIR
jgi:hypothetical protein